MTPGSDAGKTCKEPVHIHARPAGHVEARLDIAGVGGRMQHKQLQVMCDGRLRGSIGVTPPPGSEP